MPSTAKLRGVARERRAATASAAITSEHERAAALRRRSPTARSAVADALSMPTKNVPNPARRHQRQPDRGARRAALGALLDRLARGQDHAGQRDRHAGDLQRARAARPRPGRRAPAPPRAVAEIGATTLIVPIASAR